MSITRRTLLTASVSGLSLLGLAACTRPTPTPATPTATPSATPTPVPTAGATGLPDPVAFARSDWAGDPFARGSGSFLRPGATRADREALARPVDDRVFFAGEATSADRPGTVAGAYASGLRAADEVDRAGAGTERVAVVGAGIAGTAAARALRDAGHDVVLVEARAELGGRIRAAGGTESPDWPHPAEVGALWLAADDDHVLRDAVEAAGISRYGLALIAEHRGPDGQVRDPSTAGSDALAAARAHALAQPGAISLAAALRDTGGDDLDAAGGAASPAADLAALLATDVAIAHGAAPDEISAAHGLDEPAPVGNVAVTGGFAGLVQHLLRDQDIDVLREATVSRIAYGEGRVGLRLGSGESLSVDRVVVTVPLGVLQEGAIAFDPALPAAHDQAIRALGPGRADRVWLRFAAPFWSTTATVWTSHDADGSITRWYNLMPISGEPVLMAEVGALAAERVAAMDDQELRAAALRTLLPFADPDLVGPATPAPTDGPGGTATPSPTPTPTP
ncbi:FAD-dependent oxidoreductase [Clavibacter sp. Sh2141]|uniref:flavin monoamine oxidase family protein n=1 Tax=Clavibacter sp. Sh2141 TaxID=3395374 RepID=UPI0039BC9606